MPKFTTIFRIVVMAGAAVIAVEGWHRYGPTTQQLKSLATRALEIAHEALNKPQLKPADTSSLGVSQANDAPPLSITPPSETAVAPPIAAKNGFPIAPTIFEPDATGGMAPLSHEPSTANTVNADRLPALMNRLQQLGGMEPQLVPWGNSGQLYRFCCQAALSNTPSLKRHFESVAAEPEIAVADVVAKVESWRTAQQDRSRPQ